MADWKIAHSAIEAYPEEVDTTSSPTTVRVRRNIHEVELPGMEEGETTKVYEFEEKLYTKDEYAMIKSIDETVRVRHESDIIDEYTEALVEEGIL